MSGIIGWFASILIGRDMPGGVVGNVLAGFIGAWLGTALFGAWGPKIFGLSIIPAIVGSMIIVFTVGWIRTLARKR
nr:GlsB/YeaQ/YmgE family stress response membrane protein [Bacillus sp. FJAT-47783]